MRPAIFIAQIFRKILVSKNFNDAPSCNCTAARLKTFAPLETKSSGSRYESMAALTLSTCTASTVDRDLAATNLAIKIKFGVASHERQ